MKQSARGPNGRFLEVESHEAYHERMEERDLRAPDLWTRTIEASRYEAMAKQTRGSFAVLLIGDRPFWSKGWRGCQHNCWRPVDDWSQPMVERITVKDGVVSRGFYCR